MKMFIKRLSFIVAAFGRLTIAPSAAISFSTATEVTAGGNDNENFPRTLQESTCICEDGQTTEDKVTTIRMLAPGGAGHHNDVVTERFRGRAAAFQERTGVQVEVIGLGHVADLNEEILADAEAHVYDGYVLIPSITGELMEKNGLADLTDFVAKNEDVAWTDILSFVRNNQAVYNGAVRTIPCDGDVLSMFYRKDLFDQYNLSVPRTWDEYAERAEFFHGMEVPAGDGSNATVTLAGSCIARAEPCEALPYFNNVVLAATTQTKGTSSGAFFDPVTFEPLFGEAMVETLRHLENQAKYGAYSELNHEGSCPWPIAQFAQGTCAMTYSWGNEFTQHLQSGSIIEGKLGIAMTPGVTKVLDRSTGKLVQCTEATCPYGKTYPDIGRVNYAPYAAAGGWSGGVASGVGSKRQQAMAEFLGFVCGKEESLKDTIPDARGTLFTGTDPYRKSHFENLDQWVAQGYPLDAATQYQDTILAELGSPNAVLDVRFPNAYELMASMHYAVNRHLVESSKREMTEEDRLAMAKSLETEWKDIITEYDKNKPVTADPLKIAYQKSVNSYIPPSLTSATISLRTIAAIVAGCSMFIGFIVGLIVYFISLRRIEEEKRLAEIRAAQRLIEKEEDDDSSLA